MTTMSTQTTTTTTTPATPTGRDERGRFTEGNTFGRGNPHARQAAAMRKALMAAVTPVEMTILAQTTLAYAMKGNMAAARLLFQYCLGTPLAGGNPDLIDLDEFQTLKAKAVPLEEVRAACASDKIPAALAAPMVNGAQHAATQQLGGALLDGLAAQDAAQQAAEEDDYDAADPGDADPLPLPGGQRTGRDARAANRGQSVPAPERRSTPVSDAYDPRR